MATLSTQQKAAIKADILASVDLNGQPDTVIASLYNATVPAFIVWRKRVPIMEIGRSMLSTDVAGLTTANLNRLLVMAAFSGGSLDASSDAEAGYADVFSVAGAAGTRAALKATFRRAALRIEKLFATGTGSDPSPATLVFEGTITPQQVSDSLAGV